MLATLEYQPQKGGIATYLSNLVAALPEGRVHVLAPKDGDTHDHDIGQHNLIFRRQMMAPILKARWLSALYWTDWLVRKEQPSVLVVSHVLPMGTVAGIIKRWHATPYVVILHGMDIALALDAGGRKSSQAKEALAGASLVVVNSSFTARLAQSAGVPAERLMIVHPSPSFTAPEIVSPAEVRTTREHYGLGSSHVILTLGRMVRRKGFDTAIQALAVLVKRGEDVMLVVAGDGPDRQHLHELAFTLGVSDRVRFLGPIDHEELPGLYAACDVFVMAARSDGPDVEGFGIVYLEANLLGKPVIGTRTGGVPDAVIDGETGLLVAPSDPDALAHAISKLRQDTGLAARLGMQGRKRAVERFDPAMQMKPLAEFLKDFMV